MSDTGEASETVTRMKVAAIQLVSGANIAQNLERTVFWVKQAAARGAGVVVLPENFALLESKKGLELGRQEATENGPVRRQLAKLARECQLWIVAGSLPCALRPDGSEVAGRVRAVCWVINPQGQFVGRYDKIHLFDVDVEDAFGSYRESRYIEPGEKTVCTETPLGRVGLSICYDLRFPELYRQLIAQGASWIVVPAAFTFTTGQAHWETLLRARAIENQVYIVAPNQGGKHDSRRETYGYSMIIDPWGKVVACHEEPGEGMVVATMDMAKLEAIRKKMPVIQHRRL